MIDKKNLVELTQKSHDTINFVFELLLARKELTEDEKDFCRWWDEELAYLRKNERDESAISTYRLIGTDVAGYEAMLRRKVRSGEDRENITNALTVVKQIKYDKVRAVSQRRKEIALERSIAELCEFRYGKVIARNKCCCPIHSETMPSFTIYPNNTFFCFGCRAGGDIIDLVMLVDKCDYREAIRILVEDTH